jgi:hypothetical protein
MGALNFANLREHFGTKQLQYAFAWDQATGNLIYEGVAVRGALESEPKWLIVKNTYNAQNLLTSEKMAPLMSIWNNRTSLTYA